MQGVKISQQGHGNSKNRSPRRPAAGAYTSLEPESATQEGGGSRLQSTPSLRPTLRRLQSTPSLPHVHWPAPGGRVPGVQLACSEILLLGGL
jgi:hypothetical protein